MSDKWRRRIVRWLVLKLGSDLTIMQNVDIGGSIRIPPNADNPIMRNCRISGGAIYMPSGSISGSPIHLADSARATGTTPFRPPTDPR